MTRLHTACWALTASAFVLAGLLLFTAAQHTRATEAHAAQVIARDNFTLMTAETRNDEEALFVLDNASGALMVYRLDITEEVLEPAAGLMLEEIFREGGGDDADRRGRRGDGR